MREKVGLNQTTGLKENERGQAHKSHQLPKLEADVSRAPKGRLRGPPVMASPEKSMRTENRSPDLLPYCQEDTGNHLLCPDALLEKRRRERASERLDIYPK